MQNKEVFQAGKTWSCKGISNLCMSQRLFRTLLSNTWRLSISYGNDNLVQRTKIMRFMIQLPHIPVDPFHLSCMQNGWQNSILLHTFLKNGYIIWNFLTNIRFFFFFLQTTVLGCDTRSMKLFVETHIWNEDLRKGVQQLVDSRT